MKLKNWIGLLPFCVGICLSPYTMGNVHTNYSAQTEMSVSDVEVKKKELKEFRKKYKLPAPKAESKGNRCRFDASNSYGSWNGTMKRLLPESHRLKKK